MQRYKTTEYTIYLKKRKKIEQLQKKSMERDITLQQIKIKQRNDPRKWTAIYAIVIFLGVFGAIACDDHFFKPNFFNFTAKYLECLDDATVAVQLEPTLIKPIKIGGFFNHEPSTFYFLIPSKRIVWFVAGNCTPSVNCIWCVNVCYVGKKHKKNVNKLSKRAPEVVD